MRRDVWKALLHLFPNAQPSLHWRLEAVGEAEPELVEWNLPDPIPTPAQIDQAVLDYDAARLAEQQAKDAEETAQASLRATLISAAQSAVGVRFNELTAVQVRALFAILLYREGGLTRDGVVRPLAEWVRLTSPV